MDLRFEPNKKGLIRATQRFTQSGHPFIRKIKQQIDVWAKYLEINTRRLKIFNINSCYRRRAGFRGFNIAKRMCLSMFDFVVILEIYEFYYRTFYSEHNHHLYFLTSDAITF